MSDRIDVNKTIKSKEFNICHYWYFLNSGFKFRTNVYNICIQCIQFITDVYGP